MSQWKPQLPICSVFGLTRPRNPFPIFGEGNALLQCRIVAFMEKLSRQCRVLLSSEAWSCEMQIQYAIHLATDTIFTISVRISYFSTENKKSNSSMYF